MFGIDFVVAVALFRPFRAGSARDVMSPGLHPGLCYCAPSGRRCSVALDALWIKYDLVRLRKDDLIRLRDEAGI